MMKATMVWSSVIGPKGSARQDPHARELSRACVGFHHLASSSAGPAGSAASVSAITPAMPVASRPARKASTAISLAALSTAGAAPPAHRAE